MPDARRATCKHCGAHRDDVGLLTWSGFCIVCANEIKEDNARQLAAHSGPWFQHWRRCCVAAYGGVLLDDLRDGA